MKVVITAPNLSIGGGVANYFAVIRKHFSIRNEFYSLGSLGDKQNVFERISHFQKDQNRFQSLVSLYPQDIDLVHINPSFRYASLIRDALILRKAKRANKKVLVFFHGWDHNTAKVVERLFYDAFFSTYNMANAFVVLASEFKAQLESWGFTQPIYLETTPVDDELLAGFSIEKKIHESIQRREVNLLFLSRIEKEKGIFETISAVAELVKNHPRIRLLVAGDGSCLSQARNMVSEMKIENNVSFLGYVQGEKKKQVFLSSDIYIFPTYAEGMPTTVLEAMAFGLPIVTRRVGGLKDFFVDGQFGFTTESKDPNEFASIIDKIVNNRSLSLEMGINCHNYAKERFMATQVAKRLEQIYKKVIERNKR